METTAERVTIITVQIAETSLGDEVCLDPNRDAMYEAYCDEYAAAIQDEYPDARILVRVAPHSQVNQSLEITVDPDDGSYDAYTRWEAVRARVQAIGEETFERGGWVR